MPRKSTTSIDQETFAKFFRCAEHYAYNGDYDSSRRSLVCCIAILFRIASYSGPDNRQAYINKANDLIGRCVSCSNEQLVNMLPDISLEYLGCKMDKEDNEETVKDMLKKVTFNDVAGLDDVKQTVTRMIINPIKYPEIFKKFKKKQGGGFLLYGLPGTGKTMIAKAIAAEVKAKFYPVKCSDIVSKWFGESENNVKDLFREAKSQELSILFFDEFEALGRVRTGSDSAMNRIVPELLAQIQGFEACDNIIVICATNRPWDIDSAFLRPGRLSKQIYIPLPDELSRKFIIEKTFRGVPIESDVDLNQLAIDTAGYSGADVEELCDYAKNFAIEREIANNQTSKVSNDDIRQAMHDVHSSVFQMDLDAMEHYRAYLGNNVA